jgi:2,3-bisphosphoglycerate-dependent phosphoglycerate mutase/probable phosphoglycerate mutase
VVRRARPVIDELDEEYEDNPQGIVVVVAHGGMIAGLVCGLLGLPVSTWPSIGGMANCHWAALARRSDHPRWRLSGYNVAGAAPPPSP